MVRNRVLFSGRPIHGAGILRAHSPWWVPCLCVAALTCLAGTAAAGSYLDSAHGDSGAGVKRSVLEEYNRGNCAHCHEQHASVEGGEPEPAGGGPSAFAVFSTNFDSTVVSNPYFQDDDFCFYCHTNTASLQSGGIINYDYSRTFGGAPSGPPGILEAFNGYGSSVASYHNLYDIWVYARSRFSFFKESSNPCTACHDPHLAKRNKAYPRDPGYTAISRPTDHENLWGDDPGERMSDFTASYQAPYYNLSTSTYEPDGTAIDDGSLTPDFNTFCIDCHDDANTIFSSPLGRSLRKFDWMTAGGDSPAAGDKHGKNTATVAVDTGGPYNGTIGYVLSCLDCHEPHGAQNAYLFRRAVNGQTLGGTFGTGSGEIGNACARCHRDDEAVGVSMKQNSWQWTHHPVGHSSNPDYPYEKEMGCACHPGGGGGGGGGVGQIPCEECHYHGGSVNDCTNGAAFRRTF